MEHEESSRQECIFEGDTYSQHEQVCIADKCIKCEDGEWQVSEIIEPKGTF